MIFVSCFPLFLWLCRVMCVYYDHRLDIKNDSVIYSSRTLCEMKEKIVSNYVNEKQEKRSKEVVYNSSFSEKETSEFSFRFSFPTYEQFMTTERGSGFVSSEPIPSNSIAKYDLPKKSFAEFNILEPELVSFNVEEVNAGPNDDSVKSKIINDEEEDLSDKLLNVAPLKKLEKTKEGTISGVPRQEINVKNDTVIFRRHKGDNFDEEDNLQVSDETESSSVDSYFKWMSTEGFLSDKDFGETFDLDYLIDIDDKKAKSSDEMSDSDESLASYDFEGEDSDLMKELGEMEEDCVDSNISDYNESQESSDFEGEDSDVMKELRKLEDHMNITDTITSNLSSQKDFNEGSNKSNQGGNDKSFNSATNSELQESKNISVVETEDTNKLETLWEHQDLVEQLKMELKKVRASGLPTILEDSESPKIMEDLKPWKIDEKFLHHNPMGELHKFYKSYREKMRKLDVLTCQKMYAIGQ